MITPMRIAAALRLVAENIAKASGAERAEIERACAVNGVTLPALVEPLPFAKPAVVPAAEEKQVERALSVIIGGKR